MRQPTLTIFYQFNPWNSSIGGIQTIIRTFLKYAPSEFNMRLVGTGAEADPPVSRWQPPQWQTLEYAGKPVQFLPLFPLPQDDARRRVPTSVRYTLALLGRDLASDFMHFHRLEPALAALPWPGDKTLFIHNDIQQQINSNQGRNTLLWQRFPGLYYALERSLVGQFHQIYSCNTQSAALYRQRYPHLADRVSYLKNTVDTEVFFPLDPRQRHAARQAYAHQCGLPTDTRFLLFAGRLHPQKDPLLLVQAIAALDDPTAHLLIAGDGELAPAVRARVQQLGLGDRISMLGPQPLSAMAHLQQISSLFVLSSLYEGLPVVVLEALASGTPIVTTDCGETPRLLIPGSGLVTPDRTPEAIAASLRQILAHPQAFAAHTCAQAAQPYSAKAVTHGVYADMLHRWEYQSARSTAHALSIQEAKLP
jgi:glycosyltransferase involved in cell wall biosynthesis